MSPFHSILHIDASARGEDSVSRQLSRKVVERFSDLGPVQVTTRNVADGLPFVDGDWVAANFTPADARTDAQRTKLSFSDSLVEEVMAADTLVIGMPIYNFGVPATLKAWVDMVARAGLTFNYTENGPKGLLSGKRAIVLVASGGTQVGSEIDFATPYLRHALAFIGITDVTFIAADALSFEMDGKIQEAHNHIAELA